MAERQKLTTTQASSWRRCTRIRWSPTGFALTQRSKAAEDGFVTEVAEDIDAALPGTATEALEYGASE